MRRARFWMAGLIIAAQAGSASSNAVLSYDGAYRLHVPQVDIEGSPGAFQDAVFEKFPNELNWRLLSVEQPNPLVIGIRVVELVLTDELPVQALVRVEGIISMCREVGNVAVSTRDNSFSLYLYYAPRVPPAPGVDPSMCMDGMEAFEKTAPLPVYGLAADTYTYSVNGERQHAFTLNQDNILP